MSKVIQFNQQDIRLVIFDKDGVLADTEPGKTHSYFLAINQLVSGVKQKDYECWHTTNLTGKSREEVLKGILEKYPKLFDVLLGKISGMKECWNSKKRKPEFEEAKEEIEKLIRALLSAYRMCKYAKLSLKDKCRPIRESIDFLRLLWGKNLRTALVTESPFERTEQELKFLELPIDNFEVVACKNLFYHRKCIHPYQGNEKAKKEEMYRHICCLVGVNPDEVMAIEDSRGGIEAAVEAKIGCIVGFSPSGAQLEKATMTVRSLSELLPTCTKALCTGSAAAV